MALCFTSSVLTLVLISKITFISDTSSKHICRIQSQIKVQHKKKLSVNTNAHPSISVPSIFIAYSEIALPKSLAFYTLATALARDIENSLIN